MRAHFGLGNATIVGTLRIEWPSGTVREFNNVAVDQVLRIQEPRRPVLSITTLPPTNLNGTLQGDPNTAYDILVSDDLAAWSTLTNITTDANGAATWSDPNPIVTGGRFYRTE